jgi:hypothetical protein
MRYKYLAIVLLMFTASNGVGSEQADEPVKEKATLQGHTEAVLSVAFSQDGKTPRP